MYTKRILYGFGSVLTRQQMVISEMFTRVLTNSQI